MQAGATRTYNRALMQVRPRMSEGPASWFPRAAAVISREYAEPCCANPLLRMVCCNNSLWWPQSWFELGTDH
jgi:hypothetical protein